jgi:hypothetical protein
MSGNGELREVDFPGLAKRIANDRIAFARHLVGGHEEVGALELAVVDFLDVNELHEINRAFALEA